MTMSIELIRHEPETKRIQLEDRYKFRSDRPWQCLQRLCFWWLRKIGCFAYDDVTTHKIQTINFDTLTRNLYEQEREIFMMLAVRGDKLIIGPEDFYRLIDETERAFPPGSPMSFTLPLNWHDGRRVRFKNLEVTIVPWMRGMVVLPKEEAIRKL